MFKLQPMEQKLSLGRVNFHVHVAVNEIIHMAVNVVIIASA